MLAWRSLRIIRPCDTAVTLHDYLTIIVSMPSNILRRLREVFLNRFLSKIFTSTCRQKEMSPVRADNASSLNSIHAVRHLKDGVPVCYLDRRITMSSFNSEIYFLNHMHNRRNNKKSYSADNCTSAAHIARNFGQGKLRSVESKCCG